MADIPVGASVDPLFFLIPPFAFFSAAEISLRAVNHCRPPAGMSAGTSAPVFRLSEPNKTIRTKRTN
ncbi:hypothetical protein [Sulfuricaulis sp.]|uniref:hypothetical protein n=1 Tax=Sulfuricaulis sp. TaxID=2003553 RepID=UPI003559EC31